MRELHLNLKRKWFDMISFGEKTEEYLELKPYWDARLKGKSFDVITFSNGYSKNAPSITVEYLGTSVGIGRVDWGASEKPVYILKLGEVLSGHNCEHLDLAEIES